VSSFGTRIEHWQGSIAEAKAERSSHGNPTTNGRDSED
jgi:hypothetical protein